MPSLQKRQTPQVYPQPGDADAVADPVGRDIATEQVDAADDLVAGDHGIFDVRQLGIDDVKVGPAYAASAYLDANLPVAGNGIRALLHLQWRARRRQHHRTHAGFSNHGSQAICVALYQANQPSFDLNQGQSLKMCWGTHEPGWLGQYASQEDQPWHRIH